MRNSELCVTELAAVAGVKPRAVSNQLQRLIDRGILDPRRAGNQIFYRIVDPCVPALLDRGMSDAGCPNSRVADAVPRRGVRWGQEELHGRQSLFRRGKGEFTPSKDGLTRRGQSGKSRLCPLSHTLRANLNKHSCAAGTVPAARYLGENIRHRRPPVGGASRWNRVDVIQRWMEAG